MGFNLGLFIRTHLVLARSYAFHSSLAGKEASLYFHKLLVSSVLVENPYINLLNASPIEIILVKIKFVAKRTRAIYIQGRLV